MPTAEARPSLSTHAGLARNRRAWLVRALDLLLIWHERACQRRQLQLLSEHQLRDIGLSRADLEREASRRFWQP